jgi:hydroxymethylpyrimidine/phosphomethylpyrimidine kinase
MPLARVITPNVPEAEILAGCSISSEDDFDEIARKLSGNTGISVLLKAGHLSGDSLVDYFYNAEDGTMTKLPSKRVHTRNTHGTGCTLSSAFAAALAKGKDLTAAAVSAKKYIEQAIISGADYEIGGGHGPVNHFWSIGRLL